MADTTIRIRTEGAPQRCPYCHQGFAGTGPLEDCAHCGARMHAACLRELRRCASCDAPHGPRPEQGPWTEGLPAPPAGRLVVTRGPGTIAVEWSNEARGELLGVGLASLLLCPLAPALPLVLPVLLSRRRGLLILDERALTVQAEGGKWGLTRQARLARRDLRGVRLDPAGRRLELLGPGEPIRLLATGLLGGCSPEELRWLAELLRRWRV